MALVNGADTFPLHSKRKRKREEQDPKILPKTKVEVRSVEEGCMGSWRTGTVVVCEIEALLIQYGPLMSDDFSVEIIEIPPSTVNGVAGNKNPSEYRGWIRPVPPPLDFEKLDLHYAQCVDVYYEDLWWEGVVFDHEDGAHKRKILFPDMGDEMDIGIDKLRITQDWNGPTETWTPRGNWLLLEVIEELKQEYPLFVSLRQIWYDIRIKDGFMKLNEWTCSVRDLWKNLLLQVVSDNQKIAVNEFYIQLELSENLVKEDDNHSQKELQLIEPLDFSENLVKEDDNHSQKELQLIAPLDFSENLVKEDHNHPQTELQLIEPLDFSENLVKEDHNHPQKELQLIEPLDSPTSSSSSDTLQPNEPLDSPTSSSSSDTNSSSHTRWSKRSSKRRPCTEWLPAGYDSDAEFCPNAVAEFNLLLKMKKKRPDNLISNVRKHLVYLSWKIDSSLKRGVRVFRYTSPEGKSYYSLSLICKSLSAELKNPSLNVDPKLKRRTSLCDEQPQEEGEEPPNLQPSSPGVEIIEPDSCPRAIMDYCLLSTEKNNGGWYCRRDAKMKHLLAEAKKQLTAAGWSFWLVDKSGRQELRYGSPSGKAYFSLITACKGFMEENGHSVPSLVSGKKRKPEKQNVVGSQIQKNLKGPELLKQNPNCIMRSSKRARQVAVPSSSQRAPRTVLSWLIDNNAVLPRAKVSYCNRKDGHPMAKGRITRDGIKCNCCQEIFTLTKFEAHAGSNYHRPAANIFLEDGRSLLDCQLQLRHDNNKRIVALEPQQENGTGDIKNDYICSICNFGGELLLCDKCPSSFHTVCLGLKDIPPGDWFCPSCCCGVCGQHKADKGAENSVNDSLFNCHQCERQYHPECLNMGCYPEGRWFCNERCEQIYLGLQNLLGKPVQVDKDNNLTWTLMKNIEHDGNHDAEALTENYSKLNVALGVMHECFEPVKEARTKRDLVEDVIFCRWSELNRLNFRGFYTMFLERNDELISVATMRVHDEKVAEVPLVATRFQYRQRGMCRILMNELEKKLIQLGVERLLLPAVPSTLNSWIRSFRFLKMTESERLKFLDYTFLDFQGTIMCHKVLIMSPSKASNSLRGTQQKKCKDQISNVELEDAGTVEEEAEHHKDSDDGVFKVYKRRKV